MDHSPTRSESSASSGPPKPSVWDTLKDPQHMPKKLSLLRGIHNNNSHKIYYLKDINLPGGTIKKTVRPDGTTVATKFTTP